MVEVEVTKHFLSQERRMRTRAPIANALRRLRNEMLISENWLTDVERLKTSSVERCFRFKVLSGDRLIASQVPPLRLLDVGKHDESLDRWNRGKTHPTIQIERSENTTATPAWVAEIFSESNSSDE
jgi:hypothetical protein